MQITETRHEHAQTAQVYTYHADYDVDTHAITWNATVKHGADGEWRMDGSIPLSSPGIASVAEEAVRDAVVAQIDAMQQEDAS